MARQGRAAFTKESHAELLRLAHVLTNIELAARFGVSLPTVMKWKRMPLGAQVGRAGRKKKPLASNTGAGAVSVGTDNREVTPEAEGIGNPEGVE